MACGMHEKKFPTIIKHLKILHIDRISNFYKKLQKTLKMSSGSQKNLPKNSQKASHRCSKTFPIKKIEKITH